MNENTVYLIQVGHGPKGAFKTRYCVPGHAGQASLLYRGINIGRGYKKRMVKQVLTDDGWVREVLAKATS